MILIVETGFAAHNDYAQRHRRRAGASRWPPPLHALNQGRLKVLIVSDSVFDPPAEGARGAVGRGMIVTGLSQGVKLITQFGSVILLSRLLRPEDFGIVAMTAPVLAFVALFQDLGLTQATIQKRGIVHAEVNYLFWINVGFSISLALFLVLLAPAVAVFYDEPRVAPLTAALALPILLYGLGAQHYALIARRMRFGTLALIDAAGAVIGLGVSLIWALAERSYWALYGGTLATAAVTVLCFWMNSRWRPTRPRRERSTGGLLHFGAGVTGFGIANFLARNADKVMIGRVWGEGPLGLYDRAYRLLLFPLQQITWPASRVILPILSSQQDSPEAYRATFLKVLGVLLMITVPGIAFMTATADVLIPFVMGNKWTDVVPIFAALGFASLLRPLNGSAGWLLVSQGRTTEYLRWGLFDAATAVTAFAIGLPYGIVGVATAYTVSEYFRTPLLWLYVGKAGPVSSRDIFNLARPFCLGAIVTLVVLWNSGPLFGSSPLLGLSIGLVASYTMMGMTMMLFGTGRQTLALAFNYARTTMLETLRKRR